MRQLWIVIVVLLIPISTLAEEHFWDRGIRTNLRLHSDIGMTRLQMTWYERGKEETQEGTVNIGHRFWLGDLDIEPWIGIRVQEDEENTPEAGLRLQWHDVYSYTRLSDKQIYQSLAYHGFSGSYMQTEDRTTIRGNYLMRPFENVYLTTSVSYDSDQTLVIGTFITFDFDVGVPRTRRPHRDKPIEWQD